MSVKVSWKPSRRCKFGLQRPHTCCGVTPPILPSIKTPQKSFHLGSYAPSDPMFRHNLGNIASTGPIHGFFIIYTFYSVDWSLNCCSPSIWSGDRGRGGGAVEKGIMKDPPKCNKPSTMSWGATPEPRAFIVLPRPKHFIFTCEKRMREDRYM